MTAPQPAGAVWRTSSRSNGQGQCVEVARLDQAVAVRDSKHPTTAVLTFTPAQWTAFLEGAKAGDFDQ
jgi:Domain of unknown function (DUF397)